MTVLYVITRYITFFGSFLRAFWQHVACRLCKIAVEDTRCFKSDELCGHIEHEIPERLGQSFGVCFLPFFMNFLLGCSFLLTGSYRVFFIGDVGSIAPFLLVWLGFSCFANCTPCYEDMLAFRDYLYKGKSKLIKIILSPFFGVCFVCTSMERYSVTVVLAAVLTVAFPNIFNLVFPVLAWVDQRVY